MEQCDTPLPLPLHPHHIPELVVSGAELRARGVTPGRAAQQCRAGGPWQVLLPGVYLLRSGPVTGEERLRAALLYAGRPAVPAQRNDSAPYGQAMVTGLAALALHGFSGVPPLSTLDVIDVLVPRTRRLRSTGCVRLVRGQVLPIAEEAGGVPVAPVARALADAVAGLTDAPQRVRLLLTEAVRGGCEPAAVVRELSDARLLDQPHVMDAVDLLLAEGRALAEGRLYALVRASGLPEPLWNVDLRLPGGPHLGGVDAYWPDQAVAVELDTRAPRHDEDALRSEYAHKRDVLERLGITVVHITPRKLRDAPEQQAVVVRTALMAAADREPAAYVVALPR
ncbi:hypothetical protein HW130_19165 [Streptomyces sp. PKU-EA00015]|uniref:hypothetical protein n=1 Tax=Streptomyces sp. PKU-EA00015 TaxID=2748326 RepID=UPI00159FD3ED|nr:hypothetical protein [Streptomyces sp. PKU-EA00015]NWF28363.1 hypothetical protein [Streptomyces sp. PKU-EA00015]